MAQKEYREPNVYTKTQRVIPEVPVTPVDMYPLVIGTGQTSMTKKDIGFTVKAEFTTDESGEQKATGEYEKITFEDAVTEIVDAYTYDEWGDTVDLEKTTDYTFSKEDKQITLVKESKKFSLGDVIYFSYITEADDSRYEIQRFTDPSDVIDFYGEDVIDGTLNKISLGAQVALNTGSDAIYVLQVKTPADSVTMEMAYKEALEENVIDNVGSHIWRINPVDPGAERAVRKFVNEMSLPEERNEKFSNVNCSIPEKGKNYSGTFEDRNIDGANTPGLLTVYQNFINKFVSRDSAYRFQTFYPNTAEYVASDGATYKVDGNIIGCAFAGLEQQLARNSQSATNSAIPAGYFNLLPAMKLRRKQKNLLAERGVTFLTQQEAYGPITVRDSLSMDMSSYYTQDPCVTRAVDYTAKTLRQYLLPYIGKSSIDPETIAKVRATADTKLQDMVSAGEILSYTIVSLEQDTDNPMCLVLNLRVGVLFPLKEIDVNIVLIRE